MRSWQAAERVMKRWEVVLALAGALLIGVSAWAIRRTELPREDFVLDDAGCHTPVTVLEPRALKIQGGAAVVFHGLAANRRIMRTLGSGISVEAGLPVYLIDLPGHGDNTDSFSFSRAEACAGVVVESLIRSGRIDPKKTVLIGHSMGGAIAVRMADREPVAATIAISPAPMILPRRMPSNLLVFSGQYDLSALKRQAQQLLQAAGGERTATGDFLQQRAFHLQSVPHATHTSLLFDRSILQHTGVWIGRSFITPHRKTTLAFSSWFVWTWASGQEILLLSLTGLAGIVILVFPCVAIAARVAGPVLPELAGVRPARSLILVEGAVCALAAVMILSLGVPLRFLHMYGGDYLASLLLLAGVLLLALNWKLARENLSLDLPKMFAAALLGFATMLAVGAWLNWQLADVWLNSPRWLRFAGVLPIAWIFCFAEEVMIGPVGQGKGRALRYAVSLALRGELWLACLLAYYELASGQVLILLLITLLASFSLLQRLATDALRHRTGSAAAAALFDAILAAWLIGAVFPVT